MYIALSLVGLTFLAAQCRSQPVRENDRPYPVETLYQPIDHRNLKQERSLQQLSRAPEQYQYQYETERNYHQETPYEPSYTASPTNVYTSRPKQAKQLPTIEQYLKEVTPTTKTAYDPSKYEATRESKIIRYNYRAESPQQSFYQQHTAQPTKETPVPQNILAYQNAIIAHQNAIYEQQRADQLQKQQAAQQAAQQAPLPHSAIYVMQNIEKTPPTQNLVKQKASTLDDEIAYYTKLQYEQQQLKQHNEAYEVKQPAPPKYQTGIPQNSKPELLATEEEKAFLYQPEGRYNAPTRTANPTTQPKEQVYLSDIKYEQKVLYQPVPQNEEVKYYGQPQQIQYQLQPVVGTYVPDQKQVRYQEPIGKQIHQSEVPSDEAFQKYTANIVKYHTIQANKAGKSRHQAPSQYVPEEQSQRSQRLQVQQYSEPDQVQPQQSPAYLGPTDEEYKQSQFKQSLGRNSSLRVLKTGKPVVFVGHEE